MNDLDRLERAHYAIIAALYGAGSTGTDRGLWVHSPYIADPEWNHLGRLGTGKAGPRDVDQLIGAVTDLARDADRRPTLAVGPLSRPHGLGDALEEKGWTASYRHTWLVQAVGTADPVDPPPLPDRVTIRPVEGPESLRAFMDAFCAVFTPDDPVATTQYRVALAASLGHEGPGRVVHYLATRDGHPAGVASLGMAGTVAGAFNLGVLPAFRGGGIGDALIRYRLARARAEGVETVYVLTEEPEMAAWQARQGYREVMTTEGWSAPA